MTVIDIGSYARYPRTGTVGTVIRFQNQQGQTFAELDSTGLLYRIDQLAPISKEEKPAYERTKDENIKRLKKERESLEEIVYGDAVYQQDGACHGGG